MRRPTPEQVERMQRWRAKGRRWYIILIGVLGWGLPVAALSLALDYWHGNEITINDILIYFIVFIIIGGYLFGATMWWWMVRSLRQVEGLPGGFPVQVEASEHLGR